MRHLSVAVALLTSAMVIVVFFPASASGECKKNLNYLADKIPAVGDKKLDDIRDQILKTDIEDVIQNIKTQGLALQDAADLMFKQADAYDKTFPPLEECISQAATGGDQIVKDLKARKYANVSTGDDVLGACVKSYIANDWGQLANRETAIQVACNAK